MLKHALRNALTPIITLGALELGTLLSGAVLTEQVFTIPGFGKLIVDSVFNRDYAVVQGVVLVTASAYIVLNLLADLAAFVVNPRLRGDGWPRCCRPDRCGERDRRGRGSVAAPGAGWHAAAAPCSVLPSSSSSSSSPCSHRGSRRTTRSRRAGRDPPGAVVGTLVRHRRHRP